MVARGDSILTMGSNEYRKWLAIGSGVGIEIGDRDLDITIVRVRPNGVWPLGALRIERYAERPAAEWGMEYARFLKRHGGSHLAATVLLPRRDVIVRQIAMPGISMPTSFRPSPFSSTGCIRSRKTTWRTPGPAWTMMSTF